MSILETPDYKRGVKDAYDDQREFIDEVLNDYSELKKEIKDLRAMLSNQQTILNDKDAQKRELDDLHQWKEAFKTMEANGRFNETRKTALRL